MNRFTDIESTPKQPPPVYGYLSHPLVPLEKLLNQSHLRYQLGRYSKIAINECRFPSDHGLTRDESAAIYLYTMEWGDQSYYQVINRYVSTESRSSSKP
ncbi:unnamed protein product [Rotaria magnacalcarata]|uniref:Uncharacterized protein n=1 Tax=Rotaria magnacalcarata TaxID=392030 RepID=A0A816X2V2_9BILA|nr:unnamed protein product [Rotaria magnacalcarata]CAF2141630.1 unnamed protein product [Rotaria magnacalcarata]